MARKSWHVNRRTFLRGTGVSLGLPWLECMPSVAKETSETPAVTPSRLCALYFGFGVSLPKEDSEEKQWRWFPNGEGREYELTETLMPLQRHRQQMTILGGLSHP
ncbi:MAG: DUF1552 domain-containing protein, partial [Planctomycetota bacterium]|nr:DUF1552 domain-containing protein [Planctomycetota bacterium]